MVDVPYNILSPRASGLRCWGLAVVPDSGLVTGHSDRKMKVNGIQQYELMVEMVSEPCWICRAALDAHTWAISTMARPQISHPSGALFHHLPRGPWKIRIVHLHHICGFSAGCWYPDWVVEVIPVDPPALKMDARSPFCCKEGSASMLTLIVYHEYTRTPVTE